MTQTMTTYTVADDSGVRVRIEAESATEAANQYVADGEYGDISKTLLVTVSVWEDNDEDIDNITVSLDPVEPACVDGQEHDWQSPHSIVGGIKSNPGVWGNGGGVTIQEVCMNCGCSRLTDTWAQDDRGRQGYTTVEYDTRWKVWRTN